MGKTKEIQQELELHYSSVPGDPWAKEEATEAQDPNNILLQQGHQEKPGEETEPSRCVIAHAEGTPRRKTTGTVQEGDATVNAQDPYQVSITVLLNEGTGQIEFKTTKEVQGQFSTTGVRPTDYQGISIPQAENINHADVSGRKLPTIRKQSGGASLRHTPIHDPGSRLKKA